MTNTPSYRARSSAVRSAARDHLRQLRAERMSRRVSEPRVEEVPAEPSAQSQAPETLSFAVSQAARESAAAVPNDPPIEAEGPSPSLQETGTADSAEDVDPAPETEPFEDVPDEAHTSVKEDDIEPEGQLEGQELAENSQEFEECLEEASGAVEDATADPVAAGELVDDAPVQNDENIGTDPATENLFVDTVSEAPQVETLETPVADPAEAPPEDEKPDMETDLYLLPGIGPGLVWMLQQCEVTSLAQFAETDPDVLARRMGLVGEILNLEDWVSHAQTIEANRVKCA